MPKERLDKILASQNLGSRKEVGLLVRRGAVCVNGIPAKKQDEKADPQVDEIMVEGKPLQFSRYVYIMMNKPAGVLSAARDSRQKTVLDLLPAQLYRRGLFPAGRLDKDTEGLLLITDDGEFAHRMLAPKSHVFKVYEAVLDAPATVQDAEQFAAGLVLEQMTCLPAKLELLEGTRARVTVREGKFHQVKRMFLGVGKQVLALRRLRIGALDLDASLLPGQARVLTEEEKNRVFA